MLPYFTSDFLPGRLELFPGSPRDYRELERFHYLPYRPATWADVWVARYTASFSASPRTVGIAVLSYPSAVQRTRHQVFRMQAMGFGEKLKWANGQLRTISRVIIHPQFRSIGLANALIRRLIANCPTRFVEASAQMGRAHPMFERAGMTRVDPDRADAPIYYWIDCAIGQIDGGPKQDRRGDAVSPSEAVSPYGDPPRWTVK